MANINFSMDLAEASWTAPKFRVVLKNDYEVNHLYPSQTHSPFTTFCGKVFSDPQPSDNNGECAACQEEWAKENGGKRYRWRG